LVDTGRDKRYVRRDDKGEFKENDDVGRSLAQDVRKQQRRASQQDKAIAATKNASDVLLRLMIYKQVGLAMPRGDKGKYSDKQKRQAEHIAEGYEDRGVSEREAKSRAWATVNKESGGGEKSGSGRGKKESHESSRKGGRKGGSS